MMNRGPLLAFVSAGLALAVATVAVVVVMTRDRAELPATPGVVVDDGVATAAAVAELQDAETVVTSRGVVIVPGAAALGVTGADVVRSVNGRALHDQGDLRAELRRAGFARATHLYLEVERAGAPVLVRRRIDGDLHDIVRSRRPPAPATAAAPLVPPDPTGAVDELDAIVAGIEKLSDTSYEIERAAVDKALANPALIARGARVVPAVRNSVADGLKLYAIRPSSVYAALGFHNGDTVHSVNGYDVATPDQALAAYATLRDAARFEVEVTRRGKPLTLTFTVR